MKRMAREVAMYLKAYNQTGPGLQSASDGLKKFGAGAMKVFAAIAAAGAAAFSAVATGAIAIGASFEQGMANTSSMFITAADSAEQLAGWTEQLSVKARELGSTTAFTAREATDAMYALASGGLSAIDVIAATDGVLKLAGATMTDMTSAAETTMSAMKQFGLQGADTNRIVNVFAAGIQNSMLNMGRLTNSMVYAGPIMASAGASIEETVAALGLLHNAGLKGSIAGTGLRMMMIKLIKPSKDLAKVLKGVSVQEDGLAAVVGKLKEAGLSTAELVTHFGPRAFGAVQALVTAGAEGMKDMTDSVTGTNAAMEMYDHQMETVTNQFKIVRSAMEETGIAIFDKLQAPLMEIIIWMQDLVESSRQSFVDIAENAVDAFEDITEFVERKLVPIFEAIKPAAMSILDSMSTFADGVKNVIVVAFGKVEEGAIQMGVVLDKVFKSLSDHTETIKVISGALMGFAGALAAVGLAAKTISVSLIALKTASTALVALKSAGETLVIFAMVNPVLAAIIAAVLAIGAGLGVAVVKMGGFHAAWIKISAAAKITWEIIKAGAKIAWVGIKNLWVNVSGVFKAIYDNTQWMQTVWAAVSKAVRVSIEWVVGALKKLWAIILSGKAYSIALGKTIGDVFGRIWDTIKDVVWKTGEAFKSLGKMLMKPWDIGDIWDDLKTTLTDGLEDAFGGMKEDIAGYWSEANTASQIEVDKIVAETAANVARIRNERDAQLAAMGPPPKMQLMPEWDSSIDRTQFNAPIGPMPDGSAMGGALIGDAGPQMFGPFQDDAMGPLESKVKKDAEKAMVVTEEFGSAMASTFTGAWTSILDSSQTGGEKWANIWKKMQSSAFGVIGKIILKTIMGEKIKLAAVITGESAQAAAKSAGAAADTATTGVKVANASTEAAANTATAASGFFKAFSSIPFLGIGLAIGAIALMMKVLGGFKFAQGGIVNGPGGVDNVPAWLSNQEYVMPVDKTRRYLPILEAMRAGTFDMNSSAPLVSASGGGGPAQINVSVPITIGPGSLLMADDDLSVKRFAKVIWDEIEGGIQKTYKEN